VTNDGRSSQKILWSIGSFGGWWDTQFLVAIKEDYLEDTFSLHETVQEMLDIVCRMEQLASRAKVQQLIGEAVKKDGVAVDEEGLAASVVSYQVDPPRDQFTVCG
jgi:hypothetical protein